MNQTVSEKLRVLVVDDSVVYRMMISEVLSTIPRVAVAGTAHSGKAALQKVVTLKPDLVTLDIELPDMDGLQVLATLARQYPRVGVIMVSGSTGRGGTRTIKALEGGAFDFIVKPREKSAAENREAFRRRILPLLRSYSRLWEIRSILYRSSSERVPAAATSSVIPVPVEGKGPGKKRLRRTGRSRVVAVGVSTGGPVALGRVLPCFPRNFNVPIMVVQHMPPVFTRALAQNLDKKCAIRVREAVDGEPLVPGTAYIAPGGHHMKVASLPQQEETLVVRITEDPPENGLRPSVDYLFRSVSRHFGPHATGVIMTGMGYDGAQGAKQMKEKGGVIIVQDEATSTVFGMARRPVQWGIVDVVAPLDTLAAEIAATVAPTAPDAGPCPAPGEENSSFVRKP